MAAADPGRSFDIVIVGSGPNGLTAGVLLAQAGLAVLLVESAAMPGGGCRSAELTLPGYVHDVCSCIHPMGVVSPVFQRLGLENHGLRWVRPDAAVAHPLPGGSVAILERSLEATSRCLGPDGPAWGRLVGPWADGRFIRSLLQPIWYPDLGCCGRKMRFGLVGLRSCAAVVRARFHGETARALFAGCAAHAIKPLDQAGTASFGLVLALTGHVTGWPCARGGSQAITDALGRALRAAGGVFQGETQVTSLRELPDARVVIFDLSPRQVAAICGEALPSGFRRRYADFVHGPGVFKIDWALDGPIPWRNPACARAATVHVGGTFEDVRAAEAEVAAGRAATRPFVLVAQPSLFDPTRSPPGCHTGWAYCHVPAGWSDDETSAIETQVERFAPGFRSRILARHTRGPADIQAYNPAMIGGDIAGGDNSLGHFLFRPVPRWNPYTTPNPRLFICSSSTPPGAGVHGMCGYFAARTVLRRVFGRTMNEA